MLDKRVGRKQTELFDRNLAAGVRIEPGPYEAVVVNTIDPARHGRLQVYIPELGGTDKNNTPQNTALWRTVSYLSPFCGVVNPDVVNNSLQPNQNNEFGKTKQSYGFWAVPPDVGTIVLVMFANGDPNRGYWIGCVPDGTNHYMTPGIAASGDIAGGSSGVVAPVTEFNDSNDTVATNPSFLDNPKPIHTPQYQILQNQGLDKDALRGTTTSSSQRDIPSAVFGISTPGRPFPDPATSPGFASQLASGTLTNTTFEVTARAGGHTLVMDDGDVLGENQLFRLRSASGHQFLMHDNGGVMYIANAAGTIWIELTNVGDFNMFVQGDFNLHSNGSLNMKFDKDVRIDAGGNFQVNAQGNIQLQGSNVYSNSKGDTNFTSSGNLLFKAGGQLNLSSGSGTNVSSPGNLNFNAAHIGLNDGGGAEVANAPSLATPVSQKIPTHEPWVRPVNPNSAPSVVANTIGQPVQVSSTNMNGKKPSTDATSAQKGAGVKKGAPLASLTNQPAPIKSIGNLTTQQTQGLLAQIGYNESGGSYQTQGGAGGNYLGKYQIGAGVLVTQGYISPAAYQQEGNSCVNDPSAWTGQNGITSSSAFLNSPSTQEAVMTQNTQSNYNQLVHNGAIQPGDSPGTVGGMLQVAHLLGAGGANTWRNGGGGQDAFGTTGSQYFNQGQYGVNVLGGASGSGTSTTASTPTTQPTGTAANNGFVNL